jgi:beta-phosphoglucomutase-like phosphatase (HAD superfamily)
VDSELIGNEVLATVLAGYGICVDPSMARFQYEGLSVGEICRRVEETHGIKMRHNWANEYYELLIHELRERVQPIRGVKGVIENLRQMCVPICVASQGPIAKIEA